MTISTKITTYTDVENFITWKNSWVFSFIWSYKKEFEVYFELISKDSSKSLTWDDTWHKWEYKILVKWSPMYFPTKYFQTKDELKKYIKFEMKELWFKDKNNFDLIWNSIVEVGWDFQEVSFDDLEEKIRELNKQKRERAELLEEKNKFFNKFEHWANILSYLASPSKANYFLEQYLTSFVISKFYKFDNSYNKKFVRSSDDNDWLRAFNDFFDSLTEKSFWVKENNTYAFNLSSDRRNISIKFNSPFYIKLLRDNKVIYKKVEVLKYEIDESSAVWPYNQYDWEWNEGLVCPIPYRLIKE